MNAPSLLASGWDDFVTNWRGTAEFLYFLAQVLVLAGIGLAYATYRTAKASARQRNTLDKISTYRNPRIEQSLHRAIAVVRSGALTADEPLNKLRPSDQRAIVFLLNEWDELALYVKYGVMDEDLLYDNYAPLAIEMWSGLRPVMKEQQALDGRSWIAFDWLAVRWKIRADSLKAGKRNELLREVQAKLNRLV
ncbi:hypothetical protein GCM10027321_08290 [Massilia terrae]|uniref:DUF4760 domain-containing protein n=1 Tax=Massilia terrae TaxID=1811224 RepID=A0ABT2D075_9BURK|nr:DUF4760 domain-containing protein [Massilia terrae]MCS0659597.1 DUF4760 domain-containing protein [Massilia terrae]